MRCHGDYSRPQSAVLSHAGWPHLTKHIETSLHFTRKIAVVCNFTPIPRYNYRIGAPRGGFWRELLNSDASEHGGSGHGNLGGVEASPVPCFGRMHSLTLTLPP